MKSARDLVAELDSAGVSVWVEGYHIRYKSAQPLLERHLSAMVRQKPNILDLLTRKESDHPGLLALRATLTTDEDACASCGAALGEAVLYQCEACSALFTPAPGPQDPYWGPDGRLRIPCDSPGRFRWWQGGQPPHTTALELGASQAQAWLYTSPFSHGQKPEGTP